MNKADLLALAYFRTGNAARAFIKACDEHPDHPLQSSSGPVAAAFARLRAIVHRFDAQLDDSFAEGSSAARSVTASEDGGAS